MPEWLGSSLLIGGITLLILVGALSIFYVTFRWGEEIGEWVCKPLDLIENAAKRHRKKSRERRGLTDD